MCETVSFVNRSQLQHTTNANENRRFRWAKSCSMHNKSCRRWETQHIITHDESNLQVFLCKLWAYPVNGVQTNRWWLRTMHPSKRAHAPAGLIKSAKIGGCISCPLNTNPPKIFLMLSNWVYKHTYGHYRLYLQWSWIKKVMWWLYFQEASNFVSGDTAVCLQWITSGWWSSHWLDF